MEYYYTALQSRTHAFLLERRMKSEGIVCDLAFMPRPIMMDLCNMGVKFDNHEFERAIGVIRRAGLPGCHVYKETTTPTDSTYEEIDFY